MVNIPIEPLSNAIQHVFQADVWIDVLFGLELVRQIHYLISERSTRAGTISGHTRVLRRSQRVLSTTWSPGPASASAGYSSGCCALAVLSVILAGFLHTSPLALT